MTKEEYGAAIGRKFNKDKSPVLIPGNTFISMVDHGSEIFSHIDHIKKIISGTGFGKKYIYLPPDSYHMTVIEGVIPEFKEKLWTKHLPGDCPLEEVDNYFRTQYGKIRPMDSVEMKPDSVYFSSSGCSIRLWPNSEKDAGVLKRIRDEVAESCGLDDANHNGYRFHISIAYLWKILNDAELKEREKVAMVINEYLKKNIESFTMPPANLVYFDTMMRFDPIRSCC